MVQGLALALVQASGLASGLAWALASAQVWGPESGLASVQAKTLAPGLGLSVGLRSVTPTEKAKVMAWRTGRTTQ